MLLITQFTGEKFSILKLHYTSEMMTNSLSSIWSMNSACCKNAQTFF